MRERDVEEYLRKRIKKLKGVAYKFTSPGNSGVPDRIVLLPEGEIYFVELKAPGKKTSELQDLQINRIRRLGFTVYIIDSKETIDELFPVEEEQHA